MRAEIDPNCSILRSPILYTEEDRWRMENAKFCTSAVNGSHIALPQHLLRFLQYGECCDDRVRAVYYTYTATRETVEMTRRMSAAGADAVLVITPCFYKNAMTADALFKHFHSVTLKLPPSVRCAVQQVRHKSKRWSLSLTRKS